MRKPRKAPAPPPAEIIVSRRRLVDELPELGGLYGERAELVMPASNLKGWDKLPIRWAVVEADRLIPSHVAGQWTPHPSYPPGVQERDYGAGTRERAKVEAQVAAFEPRLLLSDSPTAVDGPPLVTPRGLVLGGNSRVMTAQLVTRRPKGAADLRDALLRYLAASRVSGDWPRERLAAMTAPMLVRVWQGSPEQQGNALVLRDLVSRANQPLTQALDPRRAASAAAARLAPEAVAELAAASNPDEPLTEWLRGPGGRLLLAKVREAGVLTPREEPRYVGADGTLNDAGRAWALRLLAAAVVDDPDLLDRLEQSLLDEVASSAGGILAGLGYGHDVRPALRRMLRRHVAIRASGLGADLYDRQGGLGLGEATKEPPPSTALEGAVWEALEGSRGSRKFPAGWRRFAVLAAGQAAPQGALDLGLEYRKASTDELVARAFGIGRRTNPLAAVWHRVCAEGSDRCVDGLWPVPDRGAGKVAADIGRVLEAETVVCSIVDALGQVVPVARYRVADGRKLRDPRIRLVNPALPFLAADQVEDYRLIAVDRAAGWIQPFLAWLAGLGNEPSEAKWKALRTQLARWHERGGVAYPWGVAAELAHVLGRLVIRDPAGLQVSFPWPRVDGVKWTGPHVRNPARVQPPSHYFARRVSRAVPPWRTWLELLIASEGAPVARPDLWAASRDLLSAHLGSGEGIWGWAEYAAVTRDGGDAGTYTLRDGYGYGLRWGRTGERRDCAWFGPEEQGEGRPVPPPPQTPTPARGGAPTRPRQTVSPTPPAPARGGRLRRPAPAGVPLPGGTLGTGLPPVEEVNRALLEGSLLLTQSGLPVVAR